MFNVLLDPLPEEWKGYRINTDFSIGIQMQQALEDESLSAYEKYSVCAEMLFADKIPDNWGDIAEAIEWFLTSYNHDNPGKKQKQKNKMMDWDVDQWRIYAAFRSQYNIDLNTEHLHWFIFMGLLTNLEECTFQRVIDIRQKKVDSKMGSEQREHIKELKRIYGLNEARAEESEEERKERMAAVDEFNRLRKGG